jgi:hypothetical protein
MTAAADIETLPPADLREAIAALWAVPPPGPKNIYYAPEFVRVREVSKTLYPEACAGSGLALDFVLGDALNALGLPCRPPPADPQFALSPEIAAGRLHAAFKQSEVHCMYLCPLDRVDHFPSLTFGPNRIARLTAAELEKLVNWPRLRRVNASWTFDTKLFSSFTWLVVEEALPVRQPPGRRANPLLFEPIGRDWEAIEPHRGRFPPAVEDALFAILLAPWEDWVKSRGGPWRAFEVPWVYTTSNDLFVRPQTPPSADALSWVGYLGEDGEQVFFDPARVPLKDGGTSVLDWLTDRLWADLVTVGKSELFQTPVKHFFVKAFLEEAADEFLAHITTIEAALLLEHETRGLTNLVARRVSALLQAQSEDKIYEDLYNVRCAFVHGRKMDTIPSDKRIAARRLARRVINALVTAALKEPLSAIP